MTIKLRTMVFLTVCMFLWPAVASGEWFGDVYLGGHSSLADDTEIKVNGNPVRTVSDSDTGWIFGGKIGYWFERYSWLGLAGDASFSELNLDDIDIGEGSMSALVLARLQLGASEKFPKGRIQPYAAIGPGIFYGGMSEFIPEVPPFGGVLEDTYFVLGIDARGGVTVLIDESYGVFLEYGYRSFAPSFESYAFGGGKITFEPTIETHNLVLGFTWRW